MPVISERAREELKRPLGRVCRSAAEVAKLASGRRLISVGDACTIALLDAGIRPHLAVFDFRCMRHECDSATVARLKAMYPKPATYENPAGTLSERVIADAAALISGGGAVLVIGEEDLTALAFIMAAGKGDVIVYGQPGEGLVLVEPDKKLMEKIAGLLAS